METRVVGLKGVPGHSLDHSAGVGGITGGRDFEEIERIEGFNRKARAGRDAKLLLASLSGNAARMTMCLRCAPRVRLRSEEGRGGCPLVVIVPGWRYWRMREGNRLCIATHPVGGSALGAESRFLHRDQRGKSKNLWLLAQPIDGQTAAGEVGRYGRFLAAGRARQAGLGGVPAAVARRRAARWLLPV